MTCHSIVTLKASLRCCDESGKSPSDGAVIRFCPYPKFQENFMLKAVSRSLIATAGVVMATSALASDITGAGASFPAPIYSKWADAYHKATGSKVNYQSIGSSGGIKQINAKTVDFGASDMPLTPEQLEKDGLQQFPTVIGGVVPVVNVPGVKPGELKLTGEILANIYLGKINKWNDPALVALNPGLNLPATDIGVVRRADGSGTTFIFTNYLSKVSAEWKEKVKEGSAVQWPWVWVARATKACPPSSRSCRAPSATWSTPTPSRTS
jgi:ABC-type phosphate transport system substrate-binding protein